MCVCWMGVLGYWFRQMNACVTMVAWLCSFFFLTFVDRLVLMIKCPNNRKKHPPTPHPPTHTHTRNPEMQHCLCVYWNAFSVTEELKKIKYKVAGTVVYD